ncbi:ATP synthase F1 subunit gamma [Alicyclobacillus sp. TC]|uniref:ATP synthase gamma chain n=2 Tax=Alicyclobacillus tolerans TaxID=90970 RepID=A0ABT9LU22_9BACL|nr:MULTISPECIES: ATP synthase F1 subunit gamma [Alicyclobacillus]MDP9727758.1 F-type H+-transporting ATPase subunit gamma [Alicyclobacillus tengchongensis]QRF24440.1 ATP synthase F1 subunit gamma [Alicyclobacillus sp. TC]SHK54349.1 ATP synthase F1 subcomplex gamma subunit [Alicyclobacillus montanus]
MAENPREIRRRIKSVRSTAQITKALEMVAAAKLRRVQSAVANARPYLAKMQDMLEGVAASARFVKHPLLVSRPVKRTGYLVITSDTGRAGPYNAQIFRRALQEFGHRDKSTYSIFAVGRKGRDFFRKTGYPIDGEITGLPDSPEYRSIASLAEKVVHAYAEGRFDELYFIYNEFINPVTQRPIVKKVLPLTNLHAIQETSPGKMPTQKKPQYLFEPDEQEVLSKLLPRYAETLVYQAVLDAKASEHAARMAAMKNATDNAKEMIEQLTLSLNRARQAAITTQIVEVVSGAQALE